MDGNLGQTEMLLLLLMADAFEGQGDMMRAREYDKKARKVWSDHIGNTGEAAVLLSARRREAIELLKAGKALEAVNKTAPYNYKSCLQYSGINIARTHNLQPVMATLQVLADAIVEAGDADVVLYAMRIRADVEETKAIMAEYYKGVLEETRRELGEQRRAAAAALSGTAMQKSKAAKRKKQKRKAQQQEEGGRDGRSCSGGSGGAQGRSHARAE